MSIADALYREKIRRMMESERRRRSSVAESDVYTPADTSEESPGLNMIGQVFRPVVSAVGAVTGAVRSLSDRNQPSLGDRIAPLGEKAAQAILPDSQYRPPLSPEEQEWQKKLGRKEDETTAGQFAANIAAGLIRAPVGILSWKADLLTRPEKAVTDMGHMLNQGLVKWRDVWETVKGDDDAKSRLKTALKDYPVETAFEGFLPLSILLGIRKLGKGVSAKAGASFDPTKVSIPMDTRGRTVKMEEFVEPETKAKMNEMVKSEEVAPSVSRETVKESLKDYDVVQPELELGAGVKPFQSINAQLATAAFKEGVKIEKLPESPGVSSYVRTPLNYLKEGTPEYAAQERLSLAEAQAKIQLGKDVEWVQDNVFKLLDKGDIKKGGVKYQRLFDLVEAGPEAIASATDITEGTRKGLTNLTEYFKAAKIELKEMRRQELLEYMTPEAAEKALEKWGIDDYITHYFPGDFLIKYEGKVIGSAEHKAGAIDVVIADSKTRPTFSASDYTVERKARMVNDPIDMFSRQKKRIVAELEEASQLPKEEIKAILEGKHYEPTRIYNPFAQRKGAEGYTVDLPSIMDVYGRTLSYKRMQNRYRIEVEPLIRVAEKAGRTDMAEYVRDNARFAFGQQSGVSKAVDATIAKFPRLGDRMSHHILDRLAAKIKAAENTILLQMSPRYHALNRLQPFQTLLPLLTKQELATFARRQKGFNKAERALLDEFGIRHLSGKAEEYGKAWSSGRLREKASRYSAGFGAAETFNQELAWLTMFDRAKKVGLDDLAAHEYALINGNIKSQFAYLRSDVPPVFRNPITTTAIPFMRFKTKNLELAWDMWSSKEYSGLARWITAQGLFGGTRALSGPLGTAVAIAGYGLSKSGDNQAATVGEKMTSPNYLEDKVYKSLKDRFGETVADGVTFGLPGLAGLDLSYSIAVLDRSDYGTFEERLVQDALGPVFTVGKGTYQAWNDIKGDEPSAILRAGRAISGRVSGLRWLKAAEMIARGDYNFKDPAGRTQLESDLKTTLMYGLSLRPSEMTKMEMEIQAWADVTEKWHEYLDEATLKWRNGDKKGAQSVMDKWNYLFPEAQMGQSDLMKRVKARDRGEDTTRRDRRFEDLPKPVKSMFREDNTESGR